MVIPLVTLLAAWFVDRSNVQHDETSWTYGGLPLLAPVAVPLAEVAITAAEAGLWGTAATFAAAKMTWDFVQGREAQGTYEAEPSWSQHSKAWTERMAYLSGVLGKARHAVDIPARCAWVLSPLDIQARMAQLARGRAKVLGSDWNRLNAELGDLLRVAGNYLAEPLPIPPPPTVVAPSGIGPAPWTMMVNMLVAPIALLKAATSRGSPLTELLQEAALSMCDEILECHQRTSIVTQMPPEPEKMTLSQKVMASLEAIWSAIRGFLLRFFTAGSGAVRRIADMTLGSITTVVIAVVVADVRDYLRAHGWSEHWIDTVIEFFMGVELEAAGLLQEAPPR